MSKRPRCKDCRHPRGPRAVTATTKAAKGPEHGVGNNAQPRVHKKPCHCACHQIESEAAA